MHVDKLVRRVILDISRCFAIKIGFSSPMLVLAEADPRAFYNAIEDLLVEAIQSTTSDSVHIKIGQDDEQVYVIIDSAASEPPLSVVNGPFRYQRGLMQGDRFISLVLPRKVQVREHRRAA